VANAPKKFKTGIEVTGTALVNADEVTTNTAAQTLTNKNIDGSNNTITNIPATALPSNIDASNIADGSVSDAEFQTLDGVTSGIQAQIDSKVASTEKGTANGVATLDANSKIPSSQLPALAITEVFVVADIAARDALVVGSGDGEVQEGDVSKVTDASADVDVVSGSACYIYDGTAWVRLNVNDQVISVNGQTGSVSLDTDDVAEGGSLYFTDERARDAAGAMATDSSKVSMTYDDGADTLTADIIAGSLVDADLSSTAGIDATKIGNGDVDNTELSHLNGVTSAIQTQLDAKLDDAQLIDDDTFATATASNIPSAESVKAYVDNEVSGAAAANQTLSNLAAPTAINQDLLPASNGSASLGSDSSSFSDLYAQQINHTVDDNVALDFTTAGQIVVSKQLTTNSLLPNFDDTFSLGTLNRRYNSIYGKRIFGVPDSAGELLFRAGSATTGGASGISNDVTSPSGETLVGAFVEEGLQRNLGVTTNSHSTGLDTGGIYIETGNLTTASGTNNTGDIGIRTGSNATSGVRGKVTLEANADDVRLAVQPTGAEDLAISTTKYVDDAVAGAGTASAGDIAETSFTAAEAQTAQDVTGLAFDNATVRSFKVLMSVLVDATSDLYEAVELLGVQKGSTWDMTVESAGDNTEFTFDITPAGQVQYSSATYAGFSTATLKFRATTTSV